MEYKNYEILEWGEISVHIISIGRQCFNAMILKELNLIEQSLPFDSIVSNLLGVLQIIKQEVSVREFVTLQGDSQFNILGFWLGHFLPTADETIRKRFMNEDSIEQVFSRRIDRFLDYFYNGSNTLIYNNFTQKKEQYINDIFILQEIVSLNRNNTILFLSRPDFVFLDETNYSNIIIEYSDFIPPEPRSYAAYDAELDFIKKMYYKYFISKKNI